MNEIIKDIYVKRKGVPVVIDYVQETTAIPIILRIVDWKIPSGSLVTIYVRKPSGKEVYNDLGYSLSENTVTITPTTQMVAEDGKNECQVQIIANGKVLNTFPMILDVTKKIISNDAVESTDEYRALQLALSQAEYALDQVAEMEDELIEATDEAKEAANRANAAAERAENAGGGGGGGATAEQIQQIETNKNDIAELKEQVSDLPKETDVEQKITNHNTSEASHNDIRLLITNLSNIVTALLDSDDETLNQTSEIVAYIKSNKSLIDAITTSKVSVSDIVDNLVTNVSNKPLSAKQGYILKGLIDAIVVPTLLSQLKDDANHRTVTDTEKQTWNNKANKATTLAGYGIIDGATKEEVKQVQQEKANQSETVLVIPQTLTEAQKAQARANIGATAGEDVEFAESVEWLNENGDTSKKYVLPDGYIYTWQYKKETIEHNANDGTGLLNQYPQSTWGNTYGSKEGVWSSPLIEIDPAVMAPVDARNDTLITISGLNKIVPVYNNASIWTFYYKAGGTQMFAQNGANMGGIGTNSEITLPLSYQLKNGNHFLDSNWAEVVGVRICIGVSTAGAITADDIKNLKVNIPFFNKEIDGYGWYSTGQQHSNDKATQQNSADIATLKEEVAELKEAVATSPSNSGAVWYAIGDSITYGLYSTSATEYSQPVVGKRWVDYVIKYNRYTLTNLGVSGSGFVTGTTFRTIVDRNDFSSVDLVTIMLGINDWKNEEAVNKVGTFEDDISTGGTIVSELRYGIEKIISQNPYCKIILITPINAKIGSRGTEETNWAYGYTGNITPCGSLKNFADKLKEVCEYYGIQVVDMTNSSVVNRKSITTVLPDGIHPNLECYESLGKELARRITFA